MDFALAGVALVMGAAKMILASVLESAVSVEVHLPPRRWRSKAVRKTC